MFQTVFKPFGSICEVDNVTIANKYLFNAKSALTTVNLLFMSSEIL